MYDINLKVIKKGYSFWLIFLIVGVLMFGIPGVIITIDAINQSKIDSETLSIKSEIWEDEDDEGYEYYGVTYTYEVNGLMYECDSNKEYDTRPYGTLTSTIEYASVDPEICNVKGEGTDGSEILFMLIWSVMPLIFVGLAIYNMNKITKRVRKVKQLNEIGKLVKGVPYEMKETGMSVNEVEIYKPVAKYYTPTGELLELNGDARFDHKSEDYDGLVDLVIDENDHTNYFIDFEINRIGGNLQSDFYVNPFPEAPKNDPYTTNYGLYNDPANDPNKDYYR